eukprot:CAMPEP_0194041774 /NCGR_PEP_ID=MMETSP0009_2-20130614/13609_1 /TAXON_ID=210454 /ORGANISM="Grammatophora oceanica, Strain CCMP 410" /LENGTH=363 /DNA_ID=CAMNT_0038685381 /DNA_START=120 /DNA_END=1211 /DNA_ORIENTATION=-
MSSHTYDEQAEEEEVHHQYRHPMNRATSSLKSCLKRVLSAPATSPAKSIAYGDYEDTPPLSFFHSDNQKMTVDPTAATTTTTAAEDEDESTEITASLSSLDDEEESYGSFAILSPPCSPEQLDRKLEIVRSSPRSVRFDSVEIRHYGRTVDDHPCAETGPALTLTWDVQQEEVWTMDEFEGSVRRSRRSPGGTSSSLRRVPPKLRRSMLLQDWNVNPQELRDAMYWSQYIQRQRRETLYELQYCYVQEPCCEEDYLMMYGYMPAAATIVGDDCREDHNEYGNRAEAFGQEVTLYEGHQHVQQHQQDQQQVFARDGSSMASVLLDDDDDEDQYHQHHPRERATAADCYIDAEEEVEPHLLAYHY